MGSDKKSNIEKTVLMSPLLIAFVWMSFVVMDSQSSEPGVQLAPTKLDGLVNALFLFIIVYAIVLGFVFYNMNKKEKEKPHRGKKKTSSKKKA